MLLGYCPIIVKLCICEYLRHLITYIMNCEGDVKFRVSGAFVVNTNFELDCMIRGLVFCVNDAGTGI